MIFIMDVSIKDFCPCNQWQVDIEAGNYSSGEYMYVTDATTGRKYWNESKDTLRTKCCVLALITPIGHPIAGCMNIAYRTLKVLSLSHFWMNDAQETSYNFTARLLNAAGDVFRIPMQPAAILGLELASLYGTIRPNDGRKLYASIERAQYETPVLAPCFQPDPTSHLLGGDPEIRDEF